MNADIQPTLTQIIIYPIKSLDGKIVDRAKISPGGALKFDRRWAIVDERGKIVNAKRTAKIQQLRSKYDFVTISDLEQRQRTFPAEVNKLRFNHFYRLAVNTQIPLSEAGKFLNTGDALTIDRN